MKQFRVCVEVDTVYEALDIEDCEKLVAKDFPNTDMSDTVEITELPIDE